MRVSGMTTAMQQLATPETVYDSVEELRQILIQEQCREVSYEEARQIGDALVEFFEILAEAD
jgi:hypothetical protein